MGRRYGRLSPLTETESRVRVLNGRVKSGSVFKTVPSALTPVWINMGTNCATGPLKWEARLPLLWTLDKR